MSNKNTKRKKEARARDFAGKALYEWDVMGFNEAYLMEAFPRELLRYRLKCEMEGLSNGLGPINQGDQNHLIPAAQGIMIRAAMRDFDDKEGSLIGGIEIPVPEKAVFEWVGQRPDDISDLPCTWQYKALWEMAVEAIPRLMNKMPEAYATRDFCEKVVERDIEYFSSIPLEYKTLEMATKWVEEGLFYLKSIPKQFMSKELLEKAIDRDVYSICDVPGDFLSDDLMAMAIKKNPEILERGLAKPWPMNEVLDAIKAEAKCLEYIRSELQTREMHVTGIVASSQAIWYIKPQHLTSDLFIEVIDRDIYAIANLDKAELDDSVLLHAHSKEPEPGFLDSIMHRRQYARLRLALEKMQEAPALGL